MNTMVQGSELKQKLQNSKFTPKSFPKTLIDFGETQSPIDINETRDSSSSPSYSSSLNEFNYMYSEAIRNVKTKDADSSSNQHEINEIMDRLKTQGAKMTIKSQHSKVYKEIIKSLLNENLISYCKQYDWYFEDQEPQVTKINHPELNLEEKNIEPKLDKKTLLKPKVKRNHSLANNYAQSATKSASNRPDLVLPVLNEDRADRMTKKSRSSTKLSNVNRSVSSFSQNTHRDEYSKKTSFLDNKNCLSTHRPFRITDLIFKGYNIDDINMPENDDIIENENFMEIKKLNSYVTPSFLVKRFDLREPKQLELAKEDIYKRYSFINDKNVKLSTHFKYNLAKKTSQQIEKPKKFV